MNYATRTRDQHLANDGSCVARLFYNSSSMQFVLAPRHLFDFNMSRTATILALALVDRRATVTVRGPILRDQTRAANTELPIDRIVHLPADTPRQERNGSMVTAV